MDMCPKTLESWFSDFSVDISVVQPYFGFGKILQGRSKFDVDWIEDLRLFLDYV